MKNDNLPQAQNPALIAREVFRLLGQRRTSPTPESYRALYYEVAGIPDPAKEEKRRDEETQHANQEAQSLLNSFARKLTTGHSEVSDIGYRILRAAKSSAWNDYDDGLSLLFEKYLKKPIKPNENKVSLAPVQSEDEQLASMRDLLARTLSFAVASLLQDEPKLAAEAEALGKNIKSAQSIDDFERANSNLKQLCYRIEVKSGNLAEQQEKLLTLFKLLLDNMGELVEEDSWLRGQITVVKELVSGPISYSMLEDATSSLKEVIYKQGLLKHSLTEAREKLKTMMITFIDQLGELTASTSNYHEKMESYSERISKAEHIGDLSDVLEEVLIETRKIQEEARLSRNQIIATRKEAEAAEGRIHELESKLEHLSELIREDQLTGSLNRRGLDDAYEREAARADRRKAPLSVALLDLDNFKDLNDTLGHYAGDQALIHLVRIVKDTLRPTDVIARFGGEEFLILLPDTKLDDAQQTLMRVQRALTRHFFMYKNEQVLITFSAGVAMRESGESQESVTNRADKAMYQAKLAGKNRVLKAE